MYADPTPMNHWRARRCTMSQVKPLARHTHVIDISMVMERGAGAGAVTLLDQSFTPRFTLVLQINPPIGLPRFLWRSGTDRRDQICCTDGRCQCSTNLATWVR